jgi:hypothetical protein
LPEKLKEELDQDDVTKYGDKVQERMKQLKKAWHDERREKEVAARERAEAVRFAEQKHKENQELRNRIASGEKIFITETTAAAKVGLEAARAKLKSAYEAGDASQIVEAQEALSDAKRKEWEAAGFKESLQERESVVQTKQQVEPSPAQQAQPDKKAEAWKSKNGWFGTDPEMTATALGLHEKLVREGVAPSSDTYFETIDKTMRKRFPENFESEEAEPKHKTAPTVVAPASRTTGPRQVRLTTTQVAIAKKLGLSPEQYARAAMKLEDQANG